MAHIIVKWEETDEALRKKLRNASDEAYKTRIKAIILAKQGKKRYEIVERLVVDPGSVSSWLRKYNKGGTALLVSNKGGRPKGDLKWDASLFDGLAKEIDKGGYWSIPRMQEWLKKHHHKEIPEQTVWYRMDQLKYSYKSARPHPVQGDTEKQDAFKKGGLLRSWSR
jgi:transposase